MAQWIKLQPSNGAVEEFVRTDRVAYVRRTPAGEIQVRTQGGQYRTAHSVEENVVDYAKLMQALNLADVNEQA